MAKESIENLETSSGKPRLAALDSLRGLASLAVLLGHTLSVCAWDTSFSRWFLINNAFDGRSAVTMFFVLSGFVLTLGHLGNPARPLHVIPFYARRITRIWLPWFVFFLLSLVARNFFFHIPAETIPPLSHHHLSFWQHDLTLVDFLKQAVFKLHDPQRLLLPQDWSLGVELRASALIPIFLILGRKSWIALIATAMLIVWLKPYGGYYYSSFAIGILAARVYSAGVGQRQGLVFFLVGAMLYQFRWLCTAAYSPPQGPAEGDVWLVGAFGCALVILGILRSRKLRTLLEHTILIQLGRISYSLYLLQVIVLLCIAPWVIKGLNSIGLVSEIWLQFLLLLAVSAVCIPLAHFGEQRIEVPCIRLGKSVTRRLELLAQVKRFKI